MWHERVIRRTWQGFTIIVFLYADMAGYSSGRSETAVDALRLILSEIAA